LSGLNFLYSSNGAYFVRLYITYIHHNSAVLLTAVGRMWHKKIIVIPKHTLHPFSITYQASVVNNYIIRAKTHTHILIYIYIQKCIIYIIRDDVDDELNIRHSFIQKILTYILKIYIFRNYFFKFFILGFL